MATIVGRPPTLVPLAIALGAVTCVFLGWLVARGGFPVVLAIGTAAGLVGVFSIRMLGYRALPAWVVLSGLAYPFVRFPPGDPVITFDRLWILAMLGALLISAVAWPATRATRFLYVAMAIFVFAFGVRAMFTVEAQRAALQTWFDAILLPAVLLVVAHQTIRTPRRWAALAAAFAAAGAVLGTLGILERIIGFDLAARSGGTQTFGGDVGLRVSGPYSSNDILAVTLLLCLAMTLYWIQTSSRSRLLIGSAAVALQLAGITLTFFRGAWISAIIVLIVSLGLRPRRFARLFAVTGLVLAVAFVLFFRAQDVRGVSERATDTQNVSGRIATYQQGMDLFKAAPFFGVGIGEFAEHQENRLPTYVVGGVQAAQTAHNSYLNVLAEQGLFGFIPFLLMTLGSWRVVRWIRRMGTSHGDVVLGAVVTGAALAYLLMSVELTVLNALPSNACLAVIIGAAAGRIDTLAGEESRARPQEERT